MICKPCTKRTHFACAAPASCSCAHKVTVYYDGKPETDQWSYTPIPVVFDSGQHGWVWRATHPDDEDVLFDREGRKCELKWGKRGAILKYKAVDFYSRT